MALIQITEPGQAIDPHQNEHRQRSSEKRGRTSSHPATPYAQDGSKRWWNLSRDIGNGGCSRQCRQHSHAAAMGGRRMLCQSLNAEYAEKGIHVVHILVDGAVDAPDTLGKMLGEEAFQKLRETRGMDHDGLMLPEKMAETYYHLAMQHRSAWTHELDLRSFSDLAWFNHR